MLDGLDVDGLIVASPSNPTGSMLSPEALRALAETCHARGIRLIRNNFV